MTTIKPRAAARYMEECASHCPHCEETTHMRRLVGYSRIEHLEDQTPRLIVSCYCAACAGEWVETYALFSVQLRGRDET